MSNKLINSTEMTEAILFATRAHSGQTRFDGSPYILHPIAVAEMVDRWASQEGNDLETAQIVSLLHDTVEDTDVTIEEIKEKFGSEVARHVNTLTRRKTDRYVDYIGKIAIVGGIVRAVKLADLTHNMSDLKRGSMRDKYELAEMYLLKHGRL
jgi:(p)ppGpp synthase/HD superfamily hydrolase